MALSINITDNNTGITYNYVTFDCVKSKFSYQGCLITMRCWLDSTARDEGKDALIFQQIHIKSTDSLYISYLNESVVSLAGNTDLKQIYSYIKTLDGTQTSNNPFYALSGIDFTTATDA